MTEDTLLVLPTDTDPGEAVDLGPRTDSLEDSLRLRHAPATEPDEAVAACRPSLYLMWEQGRDKLGLLPRGGVDRHVHVASLPGEELEGLAVASQAVAPHLDITEQAHNEQNGENCVEHGITPLGVTTECDAHCRVGGTDGR